MKINKKDAEKYLWYGVGALAAVGGLAHVAPDALASVVNYSILGIVTAQMLAGVAGLVAGLAIIAKAK